MQPSKNALCICGSGKKYKHCCLGSPLLALATRLAPKPPTAILETARSLLVQQRYAQAELQLGQLVLQFPTSGECWLLLAQASRGRGKNALPQFERALTLMPADAEAHFELATTLLLQGQLEPAVSRYREALRLNPSHARAAANLGTALRELGRFEDAVKAYQLAVQIQPEYPLAHGNLGIALQELGRLDEARQAHLRAHQCEPERLSHALHAAMLLPALAQSVDEISRWRQSFERGLASLDALPAAVGDPAQDVDACWFYLAYQNANNRALNTRLCQLFRAKYASLASPGAVGASAPLEGRRLRIGLVSQFFYAHTIGKLYQGLIQGLPREDFEVVVLHLPGGPDDEMRQRISRAADVSVRLEWGMSSQVESIRALALDVLFFPDIGMSPASYFLAFARLAAVQMVSWGHPDTTGIDTIDYYLSCSAVEPEDAATHYSERLLMMSRLPACYARPTLPPRASRRSFGLPEAGTLYGCLQALFKFHPDFDAVMSDIVQLDPGGRIVVLEGNKPDLVRQLKERWRRTSPTLLEKVIFLPSQGQAAFLGLVGCMDVLLDPLHFGSGNTMYEAMALGVPTVTWPGAFARGRIVAAAYRQMGIERPPIAERLQDYAGLATRLGADAAERERLREAMIAASDRLFDDATAVEEFARLLTAAVRAAAQGRVTETPVSKEE